MTDEGLVTLGPGPDDCVLHSLLRGESAATVGRVGIVDLVQRSIQQLEHEGAGAIVLLRTGKSPGLQSPVLLVELDYLLMHSVFRLRPRHMGLVVPLV